MMFSVCVTLTFRLPDPASEPGQRNSRQNIKWKTASAKE
jgi:hypothetical protein